MKYCGPPRPERGPTWAADPVFVGGDQEVVTRQYGASKDLESSCSGDNSHGKVKIAETGGRSSRQKGYDLPVLVHGSFAWAEGVWTRKWHHGQREAWLKQVRDVQLWRQVLGPARGRDVRDL